MAVTSPVSLSKIKAEFGGTNNFSAYVRNGSYVPNYAQNAGVPTSAAGMAMSSFLNTSDTAPPAAGTLSGGSVSGSDSRNVAEYVVPFVTVTFHSDGRVLLSTSAVSGQSRGTWRAGGAGADFEVSITANSGYAVTTNAAAGSWHSLGTSRTFGTGTLVGVGARNVSVTLSIRPAGGGTAVTWTLYMSAVMSVQEGGIID